MAQAPEPTNRGPMDPVRDISKEADALGASQNTGAAPPKVDPIDEAVDKWFVENVYNSPLSRDTDAFNYLRERVKRLADTLKGLKK